jgi:hypothetical protein
MVTPPWVKNSYSLAGHYGYIAKYRWLPDEDVVLILAVRHQLEAGYAGD